MTAPILHGIAEFRHRVTVCTSREFVMDQGIYVRRGEVFTAKAKIVEAKGSFFMGGYAVEEKRNAYSHKIYVRLAPRFDISGSAWVFEERFKSPNRWYKILAVSDCGEEGREWFFQTRLAQKSDDAETPAPIATDGPVTPLPDGTRL